MVLVDSDILIEVTRGRDAQILRKWTKLGESSEAVLCSPVSVAELWHGALPREHDVLERLFRSLKCVPIDLEAGQLAGDLLNKYRMSHGVELGDALIAASALLYGAELWTRNRKHYPMRGLSFL